MKQEIFIQFLRNLISFSPLINIYLCKVELTNVFGPEIILQRNKTEPVTRMFTASCHDVMMSSELLMAGV